MFSILQMFRSGALWLSLVICLGLAACSTTGRPFHTVDLAQIKAGQTTLEEASRILEGEPTNIYRQLDGSALAIWTHKTTLVADALYFRRELWLAFGPDGRFRRVVESTNVSGGTSPSPASLQQSSPGSTHASNHSAPVAPRKNGQGGASPMGSMQNTGIYEPAVSYSLSP